jgi:hypothetical protein
LKTKHSYLTPNVSEQLRSYVASGSDVRMPMTELEIFPEERQALVHFDDGPINQNKCNFDKFQRRTVALKTAGRKCTTIHLAATTELPT